MKKAAIVALACINVALLAAMIHVSTPPAQAQGFTGATDYLAITGKIDQDLDAIYIVDIAKSKLVCFKLIPGPNNSYKMVFCGGRSMVQDFTGSQPPVKVPPRR